MTEVQLDVIPDWIYSYFCKEFIPHPEILKFKTSNCAFCLCFGMISCLNDYIKINCYQMMNFDFRVVPSEFSSASKA